MTGTIWPPKPTIFIIWFFTENCWQISDLGKHSRKPGSYNLKRQLLNEEKCHSKGSQRRKQLHLEVRKEGFLEEEVKEVEVGRGIRSSPGFITSPINFLLASPPGPFFRHPHTIGHLYWGEERVQESFALC